MSFNQTSDQLLIQSIRELTGDVSNSSETIRRHCVYQDEFLLQFVPCEVSPPSTCDFPVTSTCGYVLASSYVPTENSGDAAAGHQVASLRSPMTFVQCGDVKSGGSLECLTELRSTAKKGQNVYLSTAVSDDSLMPLSADDGRYLLSEYTASIQPGDEVTPPLWVLCNADQPTRLLWLAGQCKRKPTGGAEDETTASAPPVLPELLSCRHLGSILRPSSLLDSPTSFYALPSLRTLLSHGCVPLAVDGGLEVHELTASFTAEYEIIGSLHGIGIEASMDMSMLEEGDASGSLLVVRYSWKNSSTVLCCPTSSASCVVLVRAVSRDLRSPAARLLRELNQLEAWVQVFGMETDALRADWRQGDASTESAADRTPGFLQEVQSRTAEDLMQWRPDEGRQADLDAISSHMLPLRQDLDFTQLFWLLVKDALGVKDASRCLLQVSRSLLKQEIQPLVYRENCTALADLVRQCLQCTSQEELTLVSAKLLSATGSSLLKALSVIIQTGFHKLERDFVHFFVSEELATWTQLAPFLVTAYPTSEDTQEMFEWFQCQSEKLRSLHCCLELSMMCRSYLSLPADCLRLLLRSALEYYDKHSFKDQPVFCLPLPKNTKDCLEICVRSLPSSWSCCTSSGNVLTTVQLSTTAPHPSLEEEEVHTPDGKALTRFYVSQSVTSLQS